MKNINSVIIKSINQDWLNKVELTLVGFKFNEKKSLVNLSVAITKDSNKYEKENTTNLFEKISVYAENIKKSQLETLKLGKKVKFEKINSVSTYGDYGNELSLTGIVQLYD